MDVAQAIAKANAAAAPGVSAAASSSAPPSRRAPANAAVLWDEVVGDTNVGTARNRGEAAVPSDVAPANAKADAGTGAGARLG